MTLVSVRGIKPVTQGSLTAYSTCIVVDNHAKQLKPYRQAIADAYKAQDGTFYEQYVPVKVTATFYFRKPKKPKAKLPSSKGADVDKLMRGLNDALTSVAWFDDCQVVMIEADKAYCASEAEEGVDFTVESV